MEQKSYRVSREGSVIDPIDEIKRMQLFGWKIISRVEGHSKSSEDIKGRFLMDDNTGEFEVKYYDSKNYYIEYILEREYDDITTKKLDILYKSYMKYLKYQNVDFSYKYNIFFSGVQFNSLVINKFIQIVLIAFICVSPLLYLSKAVLSMALDIDFVFNYGIFNITLSEYALITLVGFRLLWLLVLAHIAILAYKKRMPRIVKKVKMLTNQSDK